MKSKYENDLDVLDDDTIKKISGVDVVDIDSHLSNLRVELLRYESTFRYFVANQEICDGSIGLQEMFQVCVSAPRDMVMLGLTEEEFAKEIKVKGELILKESRNMEAQFWAEIMKHNEDAFEELIIDDLKYSTRAFSAHHYQMSDLPIGSYESEEFLIIPKRCFKKDIIKFVDKHIEPYPNNLSQRISIDDCISIGRIYQKVSEDGLTVERASMDVAKDKKDGNRLRKKYDRISSKLEEIITPFEFKNKEYEHLIKIKYSDK